MAPIVPLLLGGGAIALIFALMGDKKAKADTADKTPGKLPAKTPDADLSPEVKADILKAETTKDPKHLKSAAAKAAKEGKPKQAKAIKKRYDGMRVETNAVTYKSPLSGVDAKAWTAYVNCSKGASARTITPDFHMGLFAFGARRLVDLKVMKGPKRGVYKGRQVWTATWVPPLNINRFLADSALQYRLFVNSNADYSKRFLSTPALQKYIGTVIDGKKVTLSGILAICHKAGFAGAQQWLTKPKDRAKFAATTAAFKRCNGIF